VFVSCGNCDAEYELNDAKIPAGGARVRCMNCNHSFVVTPPEASDLRSADDLAHEALAAEAQRRAEPDPKPKAAPVKSFDFGDEDDPDPEFEAASESGFVLNDDIDLDLEFEAEPDAGLAVDGEIDPDPEAEAALDEALALEDETDPGPAFEAASDEDFAPDGESDPGSGLEAASAEDSDPDAEADWEFNEEIESAAPEAEEEATEPARVASESPFDRGDEWSELTTAEDAVDDLLGASGPIEADPAAAVDALLGEIDRSDSQWGEADGDLRADPKLPRESLGAGDAPASRAADASDSFEDLSDWELFDQPAEGDRSTGSRSRSDAAARDRDRAEPRVGIAVAMTGDSTAGLRWTDRVSAFAGWCVVGLLVMVALVGGVLPDASDARVTSGSWSGAGFEADQIVGRWVDNAVAGSIYVVSGRVRRAPGSDRAAQNTLGIQLIDAKGRTIDRAPIPLTPAVPERVLRESSPAELDAFQLRRAGRIAAVGDRWISFEAVVTDLPRYADRFELQALER